MGDNVRYLKLTDNENYGTAVKQINRAFFGIKDGVWARRGISLGYFYPEAPEFECYEEITEDEAMKLISQMYS